MNALTPSAAPAAAGSALPRFASALWSTLMQLGHRRARREILQLAERYQHTRPELADQLRQAADAPWQ